MCDALTRRLARCRLCLSVSVSVCVSVSMSVSVSVCVSVSVSVSVSVFGEVPSLPLQTKIGHVFAVLTT